MKLFIKTTDDDAVDDGLQRLLTASLPFNYNKTPPDLVAWLSSPSELLQLAWLHHL